MSKPSKFAPDARWEAGWLQIFERLAAHFPASKPAGMLGDRYAELLADIPLDVLAAAALQCVASSRFFPTIAELREAAALLTEPERRSGLEVWGESIEELSKAKSEGRIPKLADPVAARLLKAMGGLAALSNSKDSSYDRNQFVKAYETAVEQERRRSQVLPQARALLVSPERLALSRVEEPRPSTTWQPAPAMASPSIVIRCDTCGKTETIRPSQYRSGLVCGNCGASVQVSR